MGGLKKLKPDPIPRVAVPWVGTLICAGFKHETMRRFPCCTGPEHVESESLSHAGEMAEI